MDNFCFVWSLVDRKLVEATSNFIAGRPKAALQCVRAMNADLMMNAFASLQAIKLGAKGIFLTHWVLFCPFYAPPQKVVGYYAIPSELLSVCPSVSG